MKVTKNNNLKNSLNRNVFFTFSTKYLSHHPSAVNKMISIIEHDCSLNITYRWFDSLVINKPEIIHQRSLKAIRDSDIFIAETSVSSTGVGQQISYALQQRKQIIILLRKDLEINSSYIFLKGTKYSNVKFIFYENFKDLKIQLKSTLFLPHDQKLEKFNFLAEKKHKTILSIESKKRNISQSELLRIILEDWFAKNNLD